MRLGFALRTQACRPGQIEARPPSVARGMNAELESSEGRFGVERDTWIEAISDDGDKRCVGQIPGSRDVRTER